MTAATKAGTQADSDLAATERRMRSLGADALLSTLVYNHCTTTTVCLVLHPSMARERAGRGNDRGRGQRRFRVELLFFVLELWEPCPFWGFSKMCVWLVLTHPSSLSCVTPPHRCHLCKQYKLLVPCVVLLPTSPPSPQPPPRPLYPREAGRTACPTIRKEHPDYFQHSLRLAPTPHVAHTRGLWTQGATSHLFCGGQNSKLGLGDGQCDQPPKISETAHEFRDVGE